MMIFLGILGYIVNYNYIATFSDNVKYDVKYDIKADLTVYDSVGELVRMSDDDFCNVFQKTFLFVFTKQVLISSRMGECIGFHDATNSVRLTRQTSITRLAITLSRKR